MASSCNGQTNSKTMSFTLTPRRFLYTGLCPSSQFSPHQQLLSLAYPNQPGYPRSVSPIQALLVSCNRRRRE